MDYANKSLADLKVIAKEKGIKGITSLKKQQLIDTLISHDADSTAAAVRKPEAKKPEAKKPETKKPEAKKPEVEKLETKKPEAKKAEAKKAEAKKLEAKKPESKKPESKKSVTSRAEVKKSESKKPETSTDNKSTATVKPEIRPASRNQQSETRPASETDNRGSKSSYTDRNTRKPSRNSSSGMVREASHSGRGDSVRRENNNTHNNSNNPNNYNNSNNSNNYGNNSNYSNNNSNSNNYNNTINNQNGYNSGSYGSSNNNSNNNYQNRRNNHNEYDNGRDEKKNPVNLSPTEIDQLDSGEVKSGILEVMTEGYGFIRCDNYLPGEQDVYVSPALIRRLALRTGDFIVGNTRIRNQNEKFSALLYLKSVNGHNPSELVTRPKFEDLVPIFPNERIHLETSGSGTAMRMVDLVSPIGKGQRGMIVSQPKTGKTTLLKQVAKAVKQNHPEMHLIILLIDERPEEVTDIKESIEGAQAEVIYSTFDELPENHKRVSEMVIERAKRLVEHGGDVMILLDSITRLARAYNLTVQSSGRTLSGGLDPAALHMPKRFFGAARNMRSGGSLTILATALVDTGSRMDDVVFEEFKGTGNMELVLDRNLSEKRIFPAIDLPRSSTRREDLLLTQPEMEASFLMRRAMNGMKSDEAVEQIINMFIRTKSNNEFVEMIKKVKIV